MLNRILSFFIPIKIYEKKSFLSQNLEITWNNGELVLDSKNTNYSYGSLQRILKIGLKDIGFQKIKKMNSILVLGVAGGSVIKTLVNEIGFKGKIIGVEIDKNIIEIANKYFKINEIENLEIVIDDAFEFVLKTKNKYDLIIIDIFQDTKMPNFLFENFFVNRICYLLNSKGFVLFNTMCLSDIDNLRNENFLNLVDSIIYSTKKIPKIELHNELIIIEKKL